MRNRETSVGQNYWHYTLDNLSAILSQGRNGDVDAYEPTPFKIYRGLQQYPLMQRLPAKIGDPRWSFSTFRENNSGGPASRKLDPESLSALVYYSYGFSRVEMGPQVIWPYHRLVPSARCFFPTELYLWLPGTAGIPTGMYHYDQLHHALIALRPGDYLDLLSAVLRADLAGAVCVVLLSSNFRKTAVRYGNYAYRLCTQEAGLVAGNVHLVAGAFGLRGHMHHQFVDETLQRLLGLIPGEESPMTVIPFYAWSDAGRSSVRRTEPSRPSPDPGAMLEPIAPPYLGKAAEPDRRNWPLLVEMDRHSFIDTTAEVVTAIGSWPRRSPPADGRRVLLRADPAECSDLAVALRRRHSGGRLFGPVDQPIGIDVLASVLRHAMDPYPSDLYPEGSPPLVDCYVVVRNVHGLETGVYQLEPTGDSLHLISAAPVSPVMAQLTHGQPTVNFPAAGALIYLVGERKEATAQFGNRGYRVLNTEAGIVAQRICVMAGAVSLAARITNGYEIDTVRSLLRLPEREQIPLFQITIGRRRTTCHYEMPIIF
jgi:SagB-type dehydrogenase family enzyme